MSAIDTVIAAIQAFDFEDYGLHEVDPTSEYAEWVPVLAAAVHAAARPEVLAEAKTEVVAWLVKKAAEQPTWDAGVLASKVDRGAVRAFIGTEHYRDAMDTHRAEVLREAGDLADELIAGLDRTGDPDSFVKADAFRGYSDRLHEIADGGTPARKDTRDGTQLPAGESTQPAPDTDAAELLALATVLEIPRPNTGIPFQLRLSHGHADRWAICDRTGRRWYRDLGWMYEPPDDRLCDDGRFTLAEAVPLAREIAATEGEVSRG